MRRALGLYLCLLLVGMPDRAPAHEVRPAYLELRQTHETTFAVLWKVPANGEIRLHLRPSFPAGCEAVGRVERTAMSGAVVERWQLTVPPDGLDGRTIMIEGLTGTMTDVLVRIERQGGASQVARLTPAAPAFVVEATPTVPRVAGAYLRLGVEHILLGIDHLLFVFALLLLVAGWRRVLGTVTAFTVAHSITLAAATLGVVHVPQQPVEAIIALSIVFVAAEYTHFRNGRPGLTGRAPWLVAFAFGLLHGFGFAAALTEVGLPQHAIPVAVLAFNLGVEMGQVVFIAAVLTAGACGRRLPLPRPAWVWRVPAYGIGVTAAWWTIDRLVGFAR